MNLIEKSKELEPEIVGLSALLSVSSPNLKEVIDAMNEAGLRHKIKVIVGGAAVTKEWAEEIGADAYGADATDAVVKVKQLLGIK
jgi:methanogenic corrinoid protein MtbC1